jgi:hypothetical protein
MLTICQNNFTLRSVGEDLRHKFMTTAREAPPAAESHCAALKYGQRMSSLNIPDTDEAMEEGHRLLAEQDRLLAEDYVNDNTLSHSGSPSPPPPPPRSTSHVPQGLSAEEQYELDHDPDADEEANLDVLASPPHLSPPRTPSPHTPGAITANSTVRLPTQEATITVDMTPRKRQRLAEGGELVVGPKRGVHGRFVAAEHNNDMDVATGSKRKRPMLSATNNLAQEAARGKSSSRKRTTAGAVKDSIDDIAEHISRQPDQMQQLIAANQRAMTEVMKPVTDTLNALAAAITGLLQQ